MTCPQCHLQVPRGAKFCPECGTRASGISTEEGRENLPVAGSIGDARTVSGHSGPPSTGNPRPQGSALADRYEVLEEIGRGGFAVVCRARDRKLDRFVAIKRLRADAIIGASGCQTLARFEREARTIAGLNHRNIVQVLDHDCDTDGHYIVMELVEGGTLRDHVKKAGDRLSVPEATHVIEGVARGLAYAHRRGLIHRDVKPSNILMARDGEEWVPKIVDFGLARIGSESDVSVTGYGLGTPGYVAPEQRRDAKSATHAADIYSLGKVFYELVSGDIPDQVDAEKLPPALASVILKCVKSSPEDRFFSAEEFIAALAHSANGGFARPGTSESETLCPWCGKPNATDARFCESCGQGLFRDCPECGTASRVQKKFCPKCGTDPLAFLKLDEIAASVAKLHSDRKWSRVLKEAKLAESIMFTPRGPKGQRIVQALTADRDAAARANERSVSIADEAHALWNDSDFDRLLPLISEFLKINGEAGPLGEMERCLPGLIRDREMGWRARVEAAVQRAIGKCDWDLAKELAQEDPGYSAPPGMDRSAFRLLLEKSIQSAKIRTSVDDAVRLMDGPDAKGDHEGVLSLVDQYKAINGDAGPLAETESWLRERMAMRVQELAAQRQKAERNRELMRIVIAILLTGAVFCMVVSSFRGCGD